MKKEEGASVQKDQEMPMTITEIKETKGGRLKPSSTIPFKSTLIQRSKTFLGAQYMLMLHVVPEEQWLWFSSQSSLLVKFSEFNQTFQLGKETSMRRDCLPKT